MEIFIIVVMILTAHFLADFVLQTEYMKANKSENMAVLVTHCFVYTVVFFNIFFLYSLIVSYFSLTIISLQHWFQMAVGISAVNGLLHYLIDYVTSKLNKWLWNSNKINLFFISIGFDQLLHTSLLVISVGQMITQFGYI